MSFMSVRISWSSVILSLTFFCPMIISFFHVIFSYYQARCPKPMEISLIKDSEKMMSFLENMSEKERKRNHLFP